MERKYASELQDKLTLVLEPIAAKAEITELGGGVQVRTVALNGQRSCTTHCFPYSRGARAEFLTYFKQGDIKVSSGRSSSQTDTAGAIRDWLDVASLDSLWAKFDFVDETKRYMSEISNSVICEFPKMRGSVEMELKQSKVSESHSLWFRTEGRSARITGRPNATYAFFHWDQCELFRFKVNDRSNLGKVLNR